MNGACLYVTRSTRVYQNGHVQCLGFSQLALAKWFVGLRWMSTINRIKLQRCMVVCLTWPRDPYFRHSSAHAVDPRTAEGEPHGLTFDIDILHDLATQSSPYKAPGEMKVTLESGYKRSLTQQRKRAGMIQFAAPSSPWLRDIPVFGSPERATTPSRSCQTQVQPLRTHFRWGPPANHHRKHLPEQRLTMSLVLNSPILLVFQKV